MTQDCSARLFVSSKNSILCKTTWSAGCSPPEQGLPEKNGDHCCVKAGHERPSSEILVLSDAFRSACAGCWALGVVLVLNLSISFRSE
jgi:hypothetical protein